MKKLYNKRLAGTPFLISRFIFAGFLCAVFCAVGTSAFAANGGRRLGDGLFAVIETAKGNITCRLFYDRTPLTVCNFVSLAEGKMDVCKQDGAKVGKPFYDGLTFHRVISKANGDDQNFMIQGGDPKGNGTGGPGYKFPDEIVKGLNFDRPGRLAMANAGPNTNGSQFFITIDKAPWCNGGYTIFGQVVSGQDVVDKIIQGDVIKHIKIIRNGTIARDFPIGQWAFDRVLKTVREKQSVGN
jgi:cyclophilin family peptidyl-prolyl cis-trans isomerase